ncbi:hypothetical protein RJ639_021018, partial [Escallonia herrerae]
VLRVWCTFIMRFKKGSRVEVMNRNEVPTSWRSAEIVSGNGHTYSVRYDCYMGIAGEVTVDRVSRKAIRPCPPLVDAVGSWGPGDVVQVFDDGSWKAATLIKALGGDCYLVRILGLPQEFSIHKISIRVPEYWQDGKWFEMGKGFEDHGDVISSNLTPKCYPRMSFHVTQADARTKLQEGDDCSAFHTNAGLQESHIVSSRTLKRASPYCSSLLEAQTGNVQKTRAIEKERRSHPAAPALLLEKVDAVAYPGENLGEKYMHASFSTRSNGYFELERGKQNGVVGCSIARCSEPNESDSDACSVGSCSVVSKCPYRFSSNFVTVPCQERDIYHSDGDSFSGSKDETGNGSLPSEEEVAANIHRLELHAYRSTLEALYASGPLSWEKEELMTNLRIMLHISNDEHLMELRNLISGGTGPNLGACISCFQRSKDDAVVFGAVLLA